MKKGQGKNLRGKAGSEFAVLQSGITQRSEQLSLGVRTTFQDRYNDVSNGGVDGCCAY